MATAKKRCPLVRRITGMTLKGKPVFTAKPGLARATKATQEKAKQYCKGYLFRKNGLTYRGKPILTKSR